MESIINKVKNLTNYQAVFILALICLAVYWQVIRYDFIWDDLVTIKQNRLISGSASVRELFSSDLWAGTNVDFKSPYYRPLVVLLTRADFMLWGANPKGYHLTNLILHVAVAILAFLLASRICENKLLGLLSGIVVAVHPVNVEAVTWIGARSELLPALFMLGALYAHDRYRAERGIHWVSVAVLLAVCGLLSKEMAVTLPILIFLVERFRGKNLLESSAWGLGYGALLVPYALIRQMVLQVHDLGPCPFEWRIYSSIAYYAKYLQLLFFPINLKVVYDVPIIKNLLAAEMILPLMLMIIIVLLSSVLWKRCRIAAFGLFFILISLLPVSGLPAIIQPFHIANRYLYIPSFGLSMILCGILKSDNLFQTKCIADGINLPSQVNKLNYKIVLLFFIVVSLAVYSRSISMLWKNDDVFFARALLDAPDNSFAYENLSALMIKQGKLDNAEDFLVNALNKYPDNPELLINLGQVYYRKNHYQLAIDYYNKAGKRLQNDKTLILNLGMAYMKGNKLDEAEAQFLKLAELVPYHYQPYYNLGLISLYKGDNEKAKYFLLRALKYAPKYANAYNSLGDVYMQEKEYVSAAQAFSTAFRLQPNNALFRDNFYRATEKAGSK